MQANPPGVSRAYALSVEPGTRLHAHVRAGRIPAPDDDVQARRYRHADATLTAAGLRWYEISNWAAGDAARCAHNLGYWRSHDWWGLGPGAHSHVGGVRWWNVLHPSRYARAAAAGESPAAGRELLTAAQRRTERHAAGRPARRGPRAVRAGAGGAARSRATGCSIRPRLRAGVPGSRSTGGCWPTGSHATCSGSDLIELSDRCQPRCDRCRGSVRTRPPMLHEQIYALELIARGPYAIVRATGEIDIAAVGELRTAVTRAARRAPSVVVDLRPVTFMDSFALRALVALQEEPITEQAWSLHVVAGSNPGLQRLLDLASAREDLRWISPEQLAD